MPLLSVRLTDDEVGLLDRLRGPADRSAFVRSLLRDADGDNEWEDGPPTHEQALALLARAARHDARAAERLVAATGSREEVARLKAITHPPSND